MDLNVKIEEIVKQGMQKIIEMQPKELRDKIYDNSDLMKLLHVSRRTLADWRAKGKISYSQVGSKLYYSQRNVDQFIEKYTVKSFVK